MDLHKSSNNIDLSQVVKLIQQKENEDLKTISSLQDTIASSKAYEASLLQEIALRESNLETKVKELKELNTRQNQILSFITQAKEIIERK